MDIRELRIGNLVRHNAIDGCIYAWDYEDFRAIQIDAITKDDIVPIPITPEWLERFGFELRIPHEGEDYIHWAHNGFEIWQHNEGFCHDFLFGGDVNYVHQLQNLYYALTGTELPVKP